MPELPEVETVRKTLEYQLKGRTIQGVDIYYNRMLEPSAEAFQKLVGETFCEFHRYGKYLIFIFNNCSLISHLRMEGKYFIKPQEDGKEKHEHIIFHLDNGTDLRYHDTRKFGIMIWLPTTDLKAIMQHESLQKLGKEANDHSLTGDYLYQKIHNLSSPIKSALLNQEIICGLGNIYVDEVLFQAKVNPKMSAKLVTMSECDTMVKASKVILHEAILAGGTTIRSYTSSLGVTGLFQVNLKVHTQAGKPCPVCQTTVLKTRVGGRGTYYCPHCQKNRPHLIGITGGVASGKSQVYRYAQSVCPNARFFSCDEINRDLLNEPLVLEKLQEAFGSEVIEGDHLNKKALSDIVFSDENKRQMLNDLMHPLILQVINRGLNNYEGICFVEIPLLFECRWDAYVDEIWNVTTPLEKRIARIINRDHVSKDDAIARINAQMSDDDKSKLIKQIKTAIPVYLIDNDQELCYTYKTIDEILKKG